MARDGCVSLSLCVGCAQEARPPPLLVAQVCTMLLHATRVSCRTRATRTLRIRCVQICMAAHCREISPRPPQWSNSWLGPSGGTSRRMTTRACTRKYCGNSQQTTRLWPAAVGGPRGPEPISSPRCRAGESLSCVARSRSRRRWTCGRLSWPPTPLATSWPTVMLARSGRREGVRDSETMTGPIGKHLSGR